jgi:hypothetical protein
MTDAAAGEGEWIEKIVALLDALQRHAGPQLRSQHPKTVACLKAEFRVGVVPPELAFGVFARPQVYPAWVRFSNAFSWDDRTPDFHGFATKLLGVAGAKLFDADGESGDHDFLLDDMPVFFTPDPETTYRFMARKMEMEGAGRAADEIGRTLAAEFPAATQRYAALVKPSLPPLEAEYWSCVPYQLGPRVVKYYAKPVFNGGPTRVPADASLNYARELIVEWLTTRAAPARFDFFVQLQTDREKMPIDDATVIWDSPFQKVAEIVIPSQTFDTPERDAIGESLSFNPWRALAEHAPLGPLNRARLAAYRSSAKLRRETRAAQQ